MDSYATQVELLLSEDPASVQRRERCAFDDLLASAHQRIVLFGAGNLGSKALRCLRTIGLEPLAFADNNQARWGSSVGGIPVLPPAEAALRFGANALFMVTIWSRDHDFHQTRAQLHALGCTRVISTSEFRWKFADLLLPDFCQDLPHKIYEQAEAVRQAATLWADSESQQAYLGNLKWRALGDLAALEPPSAEESYFVQSLYRFIPGEVFVDGGAYDGDTARLALHHLEPASQILAIEADPANFHKLQAWLATLHEDTRRRISAYPVAIGANRGQVRFHSTGGEGACVAEDGSVVVECLALDELLGDLLPTFIKLDVEGFELEALEGARISIQTCRPILAVCVYHRQGDLWRIPLFLHSLVSDYRLFLRSHDANGLQLVCYAVPPDRLRLNLQPSSLPANS